MKNNNNNNNITGEKNENNLINYKISKLKYPLLEQIDGYKIPFVIDEIFELGYNYYLKNLIKIDIQNNLSQVSNTITNTITESKLSTSKGGIGENLVMDILIDRFSTYQINNTSKIPHSGDIQLTVPSGNKIIVEVKNYNKTIDQDQIDKLKFDMRFSNITGAIFISLNSGIVGKKRFELETFKYNMQDYYIIYIPYSMHKILPNKKNIITHNSIDDSICNLTIRLEFGICIMQNIIDKIKNNFICSKNLSNIDLDFVTNQFNLFYDEFKIVKNSTNRLEENIKKNLESHTNSIKEFENLIIKKINKLIKKKITNYMEFDIQIKNIKINLNEYNNWNILIDNKFSGMVVKISNIYDLLLNYNKIIIDKQFNNFDECCNFIKNI